MSESENISPSVVVHEEDVNEVQEQPEKNDTKDDKLIESDNDSHDSGYDLQMQQLSTDIENHLNNLVKVTIESTEATQKKFEDGHIGENDDEASTNNSTKGSIEDSTSGSTHDYIKDTKISIDDIIEYIDDNVESTEETTTSKDELINEAETDLSQTKSKDDFVEITVDNEEFVEIPLDDMTEADIINTGGTGENVDENGYATIPSKTKNPEEKLDQENETEEEEPVSEGEQHTKWYYITWVFTIAVMIIIFISICGLGYFFSKDKRAYPPPIDDKTAYMQAFNGTDEDYEIDVHNNRTLARQKYPWIPYLWLPEPPSSAILG